MSVVRDNLLSRLGYTPYCGSDHCSRGWPRATFNGAQFECSCGWKSRFDPAFVSEYKAAQMRLSKEA